MSDLNKLPNIITLIRLLFGAPATIALYKSGYEYAWIIFIFFVFTDWLDGFIARRCGMETKIGTVLDPLGDQFLVLPILWYWAYEGLIMNYNLPLLLTARETIMILVRLSSKKAIPANFLGKIKIAFEYAGIFLILLGYFWDAFFAFFCALVFAYVSLIVYAFDAVKARYENHSA